MNSGAMERVKAVGPRRVMIVGASFLLAVSALIPFAGWVQGGIPDGDISARMEPRQIAPGETAVLTVQISGEPSGPPSISRVPGLRFFPMGQSSRYESVNGRVSSTVSYIYQVQAENPGDYTIPPVQAEINGRVRKTRPVTLVVTAQRAGRSPVLGTHQSSHSRTTGQARSSGVRPGEEDQVAFLRVSPAKDRSYVGELVPVKIRAFFRHGLQAALNSLPVISNSAFSWEGLSKEPARTEEIIDNIAYTVLTWNAALCGVKEGEYPVSAELEITVAVPERPRLGRNPFGNGFFDDDFFNSFFTGVREETLTLTSQEKRMRVLPLPKTGRPSNFNGAVGRFTLRTGAEPKRCMVGDPITLRITVKGRGTFNRVSSPSLTTSRGWRTYAPTASFTPSDSSGYRGRKRFEQAIIPMEASIKTIPPVEFCYFNTDTGRYVTLRSKPIGIKVEPDFAQGKRVTAGGSGQGETDGGEKNRSRQDRATPDLAPVRVSLGRPVTDLKPVTSNPWFVGFQGIPLGLLFAGFFLGRRNRRCSRDPGLIRKKEVRKKVGRAIREMDRAMAEHDVPLFFNACRAAARERLGELWSLAPETITLVEIRARLGKDGAGIRQVFENADAVTYSGQGFSHEDLKRCREMLLNELGNLDNPDTGERGPGRDTGGLRK
ncbi:MAG: protein BatD [Deltaproteobacteria bacterium]|nr:protein BatD [Deltaproteobacteria bacterium]